MTELRWAAPRQELGRSDPDAGLPAIGSALLALLLVVLTAAPVVSNRLQALNVVCLVAFPFLLRRIAQQKRLVVVVATLGAWAAGQLIADVANGLGPRPSLELLVAVSMMSLVPALVLLAGGDYRRMRWIAAGVTAGLFVDLLLVERLPVTLPDSWKYGYNEPAALCLLALADLAWEKGRRVPAFLALLGVAALGVVTDHRHLSGVALLTLLLVLPRRRRHRHPGVVSVVLGLALLAGALFVGFVPAAQAGWLGQRSGTQIEQFGGNPALFVANVRPEPLQELYLFAHRPVTGYGSQPQLDTATFDGSLRFLQELGVHRSDIQQRWLTLVSTKGVPLHAGVMDYLVFAGLAAVPFAVVLLGTALWAGVQAIRYRSSPLVVFWTLLVLWEAFFEPTDNLAHIRMAAYLALAVTTIGRTGTGGVRPVAATSDGGRVP